MFRSIRWRITLPFTALISLIIIGLGAYLVGQARSYLIQDLQEDLAVQAQLLDGLLQSIPFDEANAPALDALAKRWGEELELRVTLVARDGLVLGESDEDRFLMENHANRVEVLQALQEGRGSSIRFSDTLGFDTLYVAVAAFRGGEPAGVVRVSLPLDQVEAGISLLQRTFMLAAATAVALSVLVADWISRRTVRPLRNLTEVSRSIAAGKSSLPSVPNTRDEIGDLSRALTQMSERLRGQIDAINAEKTMLSTILQQMENGVVMVDPEGRIALINQSAERIFSIEEDAVLGRSLVETLRLYQIVDLWEKSRRGHSQVIQNMELVQQGKALQVVAAPLGDVLTGNTLLIFQDLTRVRRLETVRRDFISNISHELRTPLASLKALTETLLDGALEDPPAARRFLTRIETEVDSLSLMVQELLELARIESGRVPLEIRTVEPGVLIQGAVERLYLQAERAGLEVVVHPTDDLPRVSADPPRMQQVIMNLLHNAIKFTPPGGRITLFAEQYQYGQLVFGVRDTGVGIPADDLPRIFERFYKADRARSGGGTGLGLAISRHIVESHGGKIWAESQEGVGSTFYFSLSVGEDSD